MWGEGANPLSYQIGWGYVPSTTLIAAYTSGAPQSVTIKGQITLKGRAIVKWPTPRPRPVLVTARRKSRLS
jgi:hypothetical protein